MVVRGRLPLPSGSSTMIESVVSSSDATLAAFCKRRANDLGRVDDAGVEHVAVFVVQGIVSVRLVLVLLDVFDDDGAVKAGILGDGPQRHLQHLGDDLDADVLVASQASASRGLDASQQRDAAAGHNPFFNRGPRGARRASSMQVFALLHLGFGGGPDVDLGDAAGQLGQPLLQLFAIVFAVGRLRFRCGSARPGPRSRPSAGAFDDRRVLGVDADLLGRAQVGQLDVFQLDAQILEDRLAAGEDGDVLQHRLAAIAVAGGFDRHRRSGCPAAC